MKKILTILIIVLAGYSAFYWLVLKDKIVKEDAPLNEIPAQEEVVVAESGEEPMVSINGKFCFDRTQIATEEAPYSAEEYIELNINGNMVSGIKNGSQVGPGVSNGYEGALSGEIVDGTIGVIFSYTIEGSDGKEKEEYVMRDGDLIKIRYNLIEEDGILVPDKTSDSSEIAYLKSECK
ncbi:MAG: hypothetical protein QG654_147 [Patescibacteria group bacterium]|jgi:hypothetical protein|nr:hypothetical protein [Patescibacteria group bacterium]